MSFARSQVLNMFLAAVFLGFGFAALLGQELMRQAFFAWGYPDWFRMTVGFVEVVAGGCLLIPPAVPVAAAVLGVLMLGLLGIHLRSGDAPYALIPLALGIGLAYVGWRAWKQRKT